MSDYRSQTGTVTDFKRFAVHDGDGIRTTVFLKGCPLKCVWCHNPEGIGKQPQLAFFREKCVGCGKCAEVCPNGVHKLENGVHTLDRDTCVTCGKCTELMRAFTTTGCVVRDAEMYAPIYKAAMEKKYEEKLSERFSIEIYAITQEERERCFRTANRTETSATGRAVY